MTFGRRAHLAQSSLGRNLSRSRKQGFPWWTSLFCVGCLCLAGKSLANPLGEKISSGSATFLREGNNLFITQGSEKLIIDWKEFSIQAGELTEFLQPGSQSAALNRVFGGNPSEIYGSLKANGKIYLINPNGVLVGPSGRVDTGSFVASTLDVSNEEFLKGGTLTFKGASDASVINFGTINALDGDAFLIAKTVENHGTINAPNGTAGMAGGTEVILQPTSDEKIGVSIASGSGNVVNTGKIAAAQAELKAAGGNLYALAIQNSGTIRATGVERKGGRVLLRARGGTIENTGTVQAKNADGSGGRVVLGPENNADGSAGSNAGVRVVNSGVLDASGSTGGDVTISAEDVLLTSSSQLIADGEFGGGSIRAFAQNVMEFHGTILARATAENANGGNAEVSGLNSLTLDGTADLRGFLGEAGTLTFDPTNFTIDASAAASIAANLITSNVVIATSSAGTGAGDIFVNAPLLYSSANSLSLLAHRNIEANASIQNSGSGALNLVAGWNGTTGLGASSLDFDLFTSTPSSYGNNAGSIFIGSGAQNDAVSVGSRFGETNAAAFAMTITGSGGSNTASAQFGFRSAESVATNVNGAIQVELKGDLTMTGGQANFSFAQIGHGGRLAVGNIQGAISINTLGDLQITGGVNHSYTQIGHGGDRTSANASGSITIRTNEMGIVGGTKPNAYAQFGHGDGAGDATGTRSGAIDIVATGEVDLVNGPATNAVWQIGHGTTTPSGISAADISFAAGTLDYSLSATATQTTLSQDFVDKFNRNLLGGNVTIQASGTGGLVVDGTFNYSSSHDLTLVSAGNAAINASITNGGSGDVILVIDDANPTRPNLNPSATLTIAPTANISSDGAVRIFAVNPANTHLGGFTPAGQRYNVWYGDALTVAGVNYKFHPTLTLTANSLTKTYGDTLIFTGNEFTFSGLQPGDLLSDVLLGNPVLLSSGAAATAGVAVSPYAIIFDPSLTAISGYELQLVSGSLTVTPAALSLTALNQSKIYGSTFSFAGTEFSAAGLKNGESVGLVDLVSTGAAPTAGVAGSPYAIMIGNARGGTFNPANYAISYVGGTLGVTPAPLTITANDWTKVYGSTVTFAGTEFASAGLLNSDSISSVSLSTVGALATAGVAGSPYPIAVSNAIGSGLGNYAITYVPGGLSVTPAGLTLTANSRSKEYGSAVSFAGTEFTSSGLLNGDTVSSVGLSSVGAPATAGVTGSPYAITASGAIGSGLGNYTVTYISGALSVTPAALTVTALNQSKIYGSTFSFAGTEFSTAGLKNGESVGLVDLASAGAVATAGVAGSPYAITVVNARGGTFTPANYAISYAGGVLGVTPAMLTITAHDRTKEYGSVVSFAGTEFTSVGLLNDDAISGVSLSSAGSLATAGVTSSPYLITASNAVGSGLGNYTITYVPGALTVTPAPLTVTALNQSKVYGNTFTFAGTEFSTVGLKNGESIGLVDLASAGANAAASVAGGPYAITIGNARGGTFDPANYTIGYVGGVMNVTAFGLTITANNLSKEYGSTVSFAGTEFTSLGLQNGDSIASVTLSSAGALATAGVTTSPYAITASNAIGIGLGNYTITYIPGALTVTAAPLTVTALNQSKVYGSTLTFAGTEFSTSGLKNGESVGLVDLASAGTGASATVAGSAYAITLGNARGGTFNPANYTISYVGGALSVTPAALTITASDRTKEYGSVVSFAGTEFASAGLLNGDTISSVSLGSAGSLATAGVAGSPYAIVPSNAVGSGLGNYTITYAPGALAVTPAALNLTALSQSKVYGSTFGFDGTEFSAVGLKNGESVGLVDLASVGSLPTASVAGSPYAITIGNARGGTFDPANYAISYIAGGFSVTPAALTITASDRTKEYGNVVSFAGTEFTSAGLLNGDAIGSVSLISAGALANAGVTGSPYAIAASNAIGSGLGNYTITYLPGALAVTPAPLIVTALDQSKIYGGTFGFAGTEFSTVGLKNGERVGSADLTSAGSAPTAGVVGGPYAITIGNARGGTFNPANYAISYVDGALSVTPAPLRIIANDQRKRRGTELIFDGTEFTARGLQNGETIGSVVLASNGTIASARRGNYAINVSDAAGGTYDPANYSVTYVRGTLAVFGVPPAPLPEDRPPITQPPLTQEQLQQLLAQNDPNNLSPDSASDSSSDESSVISSLGISRLNVNSFFGEQLVEPGGAVMLDGEGMSPLLPIGEGPLSLEEDLAEKPHEVLEEAIAEDDKMRGHSKSNEYEVSPNEVLTADNPGEVGFKQLREAPAALQRAVNTNVEERLHRANGL